MHTNHDIRFKWIAVIKSMIDDQLNAGVHSAGVMWCLFTARDVLDNANENVHTHSSVKTRLRIAEHFMEKAVMAEDKRHDPLRSRYGTVISPGHNSSMPSPDEGANDVVVSDVTVRPADHPADNFMPADLDEIPF